MTTEIIYKEQGDGRDSWIVIESEGGKVVNKYMVYEDPSKDWIDSLTPEQIVKLKNLLK